jgi:uncharacterized membrane protein
MQSHLHRQPVESRIQFPIHSFRVHCPVALWLTSFILDAIALDRPDQAA